MDFFANIREAFSNLFSVKLRSFLAILGILVGTGSVVAMVTCGQMATQQALAQFKALGTNLMSVSLTPKKYDSSNAQPKDKLSLNEATNMQNAIPNLTQVVPYTSIYLPVSYNGKNINASIIGATQSLQKILKIKISQGRFVSDLDRYAYYCVLGDQAYQTLKQQGVRNPIGKQIRLGNYIFTIIGVAAKWPENTFFNQSINYSLIIPIQATFVLSKYTNIQNLIMYLQNNASIDKTEAAVTKFINSNTNGMTLFFRSAKQIIDSMEKQSRIYTLMLGLIGSIALFVGGIGVMNIMLVSVTERKREIGIRMAIGARRRDIQGLFLVEAIILSLFGGTLGVGCGILASYIIAMFTDWTFAIFWLPPVIGFAVSVGIGIFFGFYPAYKASRLDPIETLRSE